MTAGPEVARVVEEFHKELDYCSCKTNAAHHHQAPTVQTKDVLSLITVMEDLGNSFEGKGTDHLILYNKEFADHVQCSSGSH